MNEYQWFTHTYKTNLELIDFKDVEFKFFIRLDENRKNWYVSTIVNDINIDVLNGEFNTEVTDEMFMGFCKHFTGGEDIKKSFVKYIEEIYKHTELDKLINIAKKVL